MREKCEKTYYGNGFLRWVSDRCFDDLLASLLDICPCRLVAFYKCFPVLDLESRPAFELERNSLLQVSIYKAGGICESKTKSIKIPSGLLDARRRRFPFCLRITGDAGGRFARAAGGLQQSFGLQAQPQRFGSGLLLVIAWAERSRVEAFRFEVVEF